MKPTDALPVPGAEQQQLQQAGTKCTGLRGGRSQLPCSHIFISAHGASASTSLILLPMQVLLEKGVEEGKILLLTVIAAPEGIHRM